MTIALLTPDELIEPPHGIENIFSLSFRRTANAAFTPAARPAIAAATTCYNIFTACSHTSLTLARIPRRRASPSRQQRLHAATQLPSAHVVHAHARPPAPDLVPLLT